MKQNKFFNTLNGKLICEKYVPVSKIKSITQKSAKNKKKKVSLFPDFQEHKDTEQLAYNLNNFKKGDTIYITLKAYKYKNFNFKVLEGIAKVEAEAPDMEEVQ